MRTRDGRPAAAAANAAEGASLASPLSGQRKRAAHGPASARTKAKRTALAMAGRPRQLSVRQPAAAAINRPRMIQNPKRAGARENDKPRADCPAAKTPA